MFLRAIIGTTKIQPFKAFSPKFSSNKMTLCNTIKPVLSAHSKKTKILVFKTDYCLMQVKSIGEHSAILWTFIKLPFTIKTFVLSIFKWSLKPDFTVIAFKHDTLTSAMPLGGCQIPCLSD